SIFLHSHHGRELVVLNRCARFEKAFRDGNDLFIRRLRVRGKDEFVAPVRFGIIPGFSFVQTKMTFVGEQIGEQLSQEKKNYSGMNQMDSDLIAAPLKSLDESGGEIRQQREPDQI